MKLIDSHFHSQLLKELDLDFDASIKSIAKGIDIGCNANDLVQRSSILAPYSNIYIAGAMGPWETEGRTKEEIDSQFDILTNNIEKYKAHFVGEIGLDNYDVKSSPEIQEYLFSKQLSYAEEKKMKVLIHNREADVQIKTILQRFKNVSGIIHCFSGNTDVMKTALDFGYYISYAGNITFKSNNELRETLKYVPSDRLLLETDAPYLTPVPNRGQRNTSLNMIHTYTCVANYLGKPVEQLADEVFNNFTAFCSHLS